MILFFHTAFVLVFSFFLLLFTVASENTSWSFYEFGCLAVLLPKKSQSLVFIFMLILIIKLWLHLNSYFTWESLNYCSQYNHWQWLWKLIWFMCSVYPYWNCGMWHWMKSHFFGFAEMIPWDCWVTLGVCHLHWWSLHWHNVILKAAFYKALKTGSSYSNLHFKSISVLFFFCSDIFVRFILQNDLYYSEILWPIVLTSNFLI